MNRNKTKKKDKGKKGKKHRMSKLGVAEMLSKKYQRKAELQEKELELRKLELEFNIRKLKKGSRDWRPSCMVAD